MVGDGRVFVMNSMDSRCLGCQASLICLSGHKASMHVLIQENSVVMDYEHVEVMYFQGENGMQTCPKARRCMEGFGRFQEGTK